jgi:hypothetical protein
MKNQPVQNANLAAPVMRAQQLWTFTFTRQGSLVRSQYRPPIKSDGDVIPHQPSSDVTNFSDFLGRIWEFPFPFCSRLKGKAEKGA